MHLVVMLVVKSLPADAGDARDPGPTPESGRSPGVGRGNPFQYSCLENRMGRGAFWAPVHGVTKSQTTEPTFPGVCMVASYTAAAIRLCLWCFL